MKLIEKKTIPTPSQSQSKSDVNLLNQRCLEFFDRWTDFKKAFEGVPAGRDRSAWNRAMLMISFRAVETLDAVRLVSLGGRPAAAYSLYRGIYEAWLHTLLIGFHEGSIDEKHLKVPKALRGRRSIVSPTKYQLGLRFIAFGWFTDHQNYAELKVTPEEWTRLAEGSAVALSNLKTATERKQRLARRASAVYGFGQGSSSWSPFRSIFDLREHLWPDGGQGTPRFPPAFVHDLKGVWEYIYYESYRKASHFVHASSATHLGTFRTSRTALIDDTPYWNPAPLQFALQITVMTTGVLADAMGCLELWNSTVGTVQVA